MHPPPLTSPNRETRRRLACSCLFLPSRAEASRLPPGGPAPDRHTAHLPPCKAFGGLGLARLLRDIMTYMLPNTRSVTTLFVLTPGGADVSGRAARLLLCKTDRQRSSVRGDTAHASRLPASACEFVRPFVLLLSVSLRTQASTTCSRQWRCVRLRSRDTVILGGHGRSTWGLHIEDLAILVY